MNARLISTLTAGLVVALTLAASAPASAAWNQPVGGASPINVSPTQDGTAPSLANIGGVPYVAWTDQDGINYEVRVARLNAAGAAWERVGEAVSPASPINTSPTRDAATPSLAAINGVPHVAWAESNGAAQQIRVARLNAAGTDWEAVGGPLPLNRFASQNARSPHLIEINGVPYVSWSENDATNYEVRVARLNPAGTAWQLVGMSMNPDSPINESSSDDASSPTLAAIAGVPYVAWSEFGAIGQIRVARLNSAGDGWDKVPAAATPLNESPAQNAGDPRMISIGDVPYVSWRENAGTNSQVRVARLTAAGTWERIGQQENPTAPINQSPTSSAFEPSVTAIGGVPYLSWIESDGTADQVRVARLNGAATGWEKVAGGPSPINQLPSDDAEVTSLNSIGGVPWVAWEEQDDDNAEIRVARLEPEFVSQSAVAGYDGATLSATWRTYGVDFPIGFDFGAALESAATPTTAPAYADTPTITQQVAGLTPATSYQYRSFALAGAEPRLLASPASFTTAAAPTPTPPDTTPPETTITKDPPNKLEKRKAKYKFTSNEPNSTFVCKFDKKKPKPCDAGKLKLKRLDDGKHKFKVYAVDAAGNEDSTPAKDKFKVL